MARAALALEDGTVYLGESFGATGTVSGEVCFNTSMTGYQEILTDPSYRGQILCMTAPQIGNYGVNHADVESGKLQMAGFVVREASRIASNFTAEGTLGGYLAKAGVVGLAGIDTPTPMSPEAGTQNICCRIVDPPKVSGLTGPGTLVITAVAFLANRFRIAS